MRGAALAAVLVLTVACGSSSVASIHSPSPSSPAAATAAATASAAASPSASAPASAATTPSPPSTSLVHCTSVVPPADNLVIATVAGSSAVVVRDIQNISSPRNLCTIDAAAQYPRFVTGGQVGYVLGSGQIVKADLATGATTTMASTGSGPTATFSFSPDGNAVTWAGGTDWHLVSSAGDRVLATLPAAPGRGTDPINDDYFLSFSPDGQYVALVQTFEVGGSGATGPAQVRRASDGSLVFSTSGVTMAVWASVPSRLFFRDTAGNVKRWDPSAGVQSMFTAKWIRPRSSPDGRWIAYTFPTTDGGSGVGFYSVQANSLQNTSPPGRAGVQFLNNQLVWYFGVHPCLEMGCPTPTGVTYIYDIGGASEATSRITNLFDAWPHVTTPGI